jgi:hypothetical protein
MNFNNLVVRIKFLLNHWKHLFIESSSETTLLIFIVTSYSGTQIKVYLQIFNLQMVIC